MTARRLALALALATGTAVPAGGTMPCAAQGTGAAPVDTAGLSASPYGRMEMLLEKSIFDVDVLTLRLRLGEGTASRLRELRRATPGDREALSDSLARAALSARKAWAWVRYHRSFGFDRFLEGTRRNLSRLPETAAVDSSALARISARLPRWHGYLRGRGVRSGDELHFRIRGDTVRSVLVTRDGEVVADTTTVDPLLPLAVLGRYFSPGSDFRAPLLESLGR